MKCRCFESRSVTTMIFRHTWSVVSDLLFGRPTMKSTAMSSHFLWASLAAGVSFGIATLKLSILSKCGNCVHIVVRSDPYSASNGSVKASYMSLIFRGVLQRRCRGMTSNRRRVWSCSGTNKRSRTYSLLLYAGSECGGSQGGNGFAREA